MQQGGAFITKTLKGIVENGKPPFASRMILGMIGLFEAFTPQGCLTEHWPMDSKIE